MHCKSQCLHVDASLEKGVFQSWPPSIPPKSQDNPQTIGLLLPFECNLSLFQAWRLPVHWYETCSVSRPCVVPFAEKSLISLLEHVIFRNQLQYKQTRHKFNAFNRLPMTSLFSQSLLVWVSCPSWLLAEKNHCITNWNQYINTQMTRSIYVVRCSLSSRNERHSIMPLISRQSIHLTLAVRPCLDSTSICLEPMREVERERERERESLMLSCHCHMFK